jgi:hypothetical protein
MPFCFCRFSVKIEDARFSPPHVIFERKYGKLIVYSGGRGVYNSAVRNFSIIHKNELQTHTDIVKE